MTNRGASIDGFEYDDQQRMRTCWQQRSSRAQHDGRSSFHHAWSNTRGAALRRKRLHHAMLQLAWYFCCCLHFVLVCCCMPYHVRVDHGMHTDMLRPLTLSATQAIMNSRRLALTACAAAWRCCAACPCCIYTHICRRACVCGAPWGLIRG
jgi:hypothetical protein